MCIRDSYKSFSGSESGKQGVHNTYLMVIGESGFIPFFIIVIFYIVLIRKAFKTYKKDIHKLLLAISLAAILMSMHNYFNNEVILFATIWLFVKLEEANSEDNEDEKDETLITQAV